MTLNKNLYLCPPDFLEFEYSINPWMKNNTEFDKAKANEQWETLFNLYLKLFPQNTFKIEAKEMLTELCFFGDSVFAYKDKALYSRFATIERFPETDYVIDTLKTLGLDGKRVPENMHFEGSGETMLWNNKILVGYGQRSSAAIGDYLESYFETETIALELIDPVFYHLDTALFPISDDYIAYYPKAFSKLALEKLESLNTTLIEISADEAQAFALNSVALGNTIIVHYEATGFIKQLENLAFNVISTDVSEFIKFGGGLKCLTFQHYL